MLLTGHFDVTAYHTSRSTRKIHVRGDFSDTSRKRDLHLPLRLDTLARSISAKGHQAKCLNIHLLLSLPNKERRRDTLAQVTTPLSVLLKRGPPRSLN